MDGLGRRAAAGELHHLGAAELQRHVLRSLLQTPHGEAGLNKGNFTRSV